MAAIISRRSLEPFRLDRALAAEIALLPKRNGERTRKSLLLAAVEIVADGGVDALTITAVLERAGRARGTFYQHFTDQAALELAITDALLGFSASKLPVLAAFSEAYVGLQALIETYARIYAANAALFGAVIHWVDHDPQVADLRQRYNLSNVHHLMQDLDRRGVSAGVSRESMELAIMTAGSMIENTLYALLAAQRSPYAAQIAGNLESVIEVISTLFYRALFAAPVKGLKLVERPDLVRIGLPDGV